MTSSNWQQGHIKPWWDQQHRLLEYINEPFNCPEDLEDWKSLGFTQSRFTGDMYDMRFPEPDWIQNFRTAMPMQHWCWSVYQMRPGDVLPEHRDVYRRFCSLYNITDIAQIKRCVVFLENWCSGHYFEIDGTPVTGWKAGDWVSWNGDTLHLAANVGRTARYTLQITGLA